MTAASAARCATLATFDVECDWRLVAALITSVGPIIQPTRQPVMAYVLATPLTIDAAVGELGHDASAST